jgi:hypothetical protein
VRVGGFALGEHIEWWAKFYQFSSNSTLLFWVPNHALPGWIAASWLVKHWNRRTTASIGGTLAAALPLWAPLVAIGLAPFAAMWLAKNMRQLGVIAKSRQGFTVCCGLCVGLVCARWITADSAGIPFGYTFDSFAVHASFVRWLTFSALEWGVLTALVWKYCDRSLMAPVVVSLLALPLFKFGGFNDLAMRASIVPLAILWWSVSLAIDESYRSSIRRLVPIAAVIGLGVITPVQEMVRALSEPQWKPDLAKTLPQSLAVDAAPHYFAQQARIPSFIRQVAPPITRSKALPVSDPHAP